MNALDFIFGVLVIITILIILNELPKNIISLLDYKTKKREELFQKRTDTIVQALMEIYTFFVDDEG